MGLEVLNCFVREVRFFSICFVGGGGQVQKLSFREKITYPHPPINKWLVPITKVPRVTTSLIFFKILLVNNIKWYFGCR